MRLSVLCATVVALLICSSVVAKTPKQRASKSPKVALQLYSVRDLIGRGGEKSDYAEVCKKLGAMGYAAVEAAGYCDGKFYGDAPEVFKRNIEAAGMEVLSSHCGKDLSDAELASGDSSESMAWWDTCIAAHKAAGMSYVVVPWLDVPKTIKELQTYCDYYNEVGKRCLAAGMQFGYHNHAHEFKKVEDQVMLDYMIEHTNPEYVFFQLDVYWSMMGQASAVDYFAKYPGRFKLLHLKDRRELGQSGMVGFDAIFANLKEAGAERLVVEVEKYSFDVLTSVKKSLDYLLDAPFVK